jgi:Fe-S cluster biosynthesis and repair protein YggX
VTRLIQELLQNDNQLQIMNGEVEKVINREKEQMLQETDLDRAL